MAGGGVTVVDVTHRRGGDGDDVESDEDDRLLASTATVGRATAIPSSALSSTYSSSSSSSSPRLPSFVRNALPVRWLHFQLFYRPWRVVLLALYIVVPLLLLYLRLYDKCSMSSNLLPILEYTTAKLRAANVSHWIDDGTLLGFVRSNEILPWDFDADLAVDLADCKRIGALKRDFDPSGRYKMVLRGDWIPEKANLLLGYSGYMTKPCARVYEDGTPYYVDMDWSLQLRGHDLPSTPAGKEVPSPTYVGTVFLPASYESSQGDVMCTAEGLAGGDPGGCRRAGDIYPLRESPFYHLTVPVPNNPERMLEQLYGADWRVPRPKGYKLLVCSWLPPTSLLVTLALLLYVAVPLALAVIARTNHKVAAFLQSWTMLRAHT